MITSSKMAIERRAAIVTIASLMWLLGLAMIVSEYIQMVCNPPLPLPCQRLIRDVIDDESLRQLCRHHLQTSSSSSSSNVTSSASPSLLSRLTRAAGHVTSVDTSYVNCVDSLSNCSRFRSELGYIDDVTRGELEFPLAFSLLTYENFEQTERLLRLIYRPHNFYCLHVDAKSPPEMHAAAEAVASCLPNVFVAKPAIKVEWGRISVVEAEVRCMELLLEYNTDWKYFINLVGRDFPLKTNREIVEILKAYNGGNDVDGSRKSHFFPSWFMNSWDSDSLETPGKPKTYPAPHGFIITKGSTHMAVSRAFANFSINDHRALDLFEWMRDIKVPDEHFFQTLNHNPQFGIPGSYTGDPDNYFKRSYVRLKHWSLRVPADSCSGEFVRHVCNIGLGDLAWVMSSTQHMFVNKIRIEQEPVAFHCLEQWYMNRTVVQRKQDPYGISSTLGKTLVLYAEQSFARNHVGSDGKPIQYTRRSARKFSTR